MEQKDKDWLVESSMMSLGSSPWTILRWHELEGSLEDPICNANGLVLQIGLLVALSLTNVSFGSDLLDIAAPHSNRITMLCDPEDIFVPHVPVDAFIKRFCRF